MGKAIQLVSAALLRPVLTPDERKTIIQSQLDRLSSSEDEKTGVEFPKDLEWFNTSGPLSFKSHLHGKVVVLDFFTYCCINCMHILPDLEALEKEYPVESGIVVIGVHSAKFENEKVSTNIKNAIMRYGIEHPVINDHDAVMWNDLEIQCWPTLMIISPSGEPIISIIGEGHRDILFETIELCSAHFKSRDMLSPHSLPFLSIKDSLVDTPLLYPGKVTTNPKGDLLAISDTGHNRVMIATTEGEVKHCIGGPQAGLRDGLYHEAQFHAPQGLCWVDDVIFVADTENHAIRKIDLSRQCVSTIAGTGEQGNDPYGGGQGVEQVISSPWDVAFGPPNEDVLFIAMAGTHQLWGLFLSDGQWLKAVEHAKGTCMNYAGSGKEENRNNSYPRKAGFAQPSGIALAPQEPFNCIFVADSESSTIRRVSFKDGAVKNVVGGEIDPMNLFAYGDAGGKGLEARLQHPLGVAWDQNKLLFVADSYNHKIKMIDAAQRYCVTYAGTGEAGKEDSDDLMKAKFNEPGGLVVSPCSSKIYVADTNNHAIRCIDIKKSSVAEVHIQVPRTEVDSKPAAPKKVKSLLSKGINPTTVEGVLLENGGRLSVRLDIQLPSGSYLTEGAPSSWQIIMPGEKLQIVMEKTRLTSLSDPAPSHRWTLHVDQELPCDITVQVEAAIYYCLPSGMCRMQTVGFTVPISMKDGSPSEASTNVVASLSDAM
ncbi:NHL repeat-containing protein 2-like [Diadema antillarum]|uniref:NHL repeat-containing protein 2-like n=1 Tax=Diadema antillarum TaxID=105358 RepID=UPI003A8BCD99